MGPLIRSATHEADGIATSAGPMRPPANLTHDEVGRLLAWLRPSGAVSATTVGTPDVTSKFSELSESPSEARPRAVGTCTLQSKPLPREAARDRVSYDRITSPFIFALLATGGCWCWQTPVAQRRIAFTCINPMGHFVPSGHDLHSVFIERSWSTVAKQNQSTRSRRFGFYVLALMAESFNRRYAIVGGKNLGTSY